MSTAFSALCSAVFRPCRRRDHFDELTVADMLTWQAAGGLRLDAAVRIHASD